MSEEVFTNPKLKAFVRELVRGHPSFRPRRWDDLRNIGVAMHEINGDEPVGTEESEGKSARRRNIRPIKEALVEVTLDQSLTRAELRDLLRAERKAIVITVPSAGWVMPTVRYFEKFIVGEYLVRDGSNPKKDPHDADDLVATVLAGGRNVIGISHIPERLLPSTLRMSADIRVAIQSPTPSTIRKAIRMALRGRMPKDIPGDLGAGLDFGELVSAIREGSSPTEAVGRLQAMSSARAATISDSNLPRLQDATFYGRAQEWALALVEDIQSVRRGEAKWEDISRAAVFYGSPGTGKTVLARMIAAEAKLPLVEASIGELFMSPGYLDSVIKAQRGVFGKAAALAPSILFWDELDALPNRATMSPRGRDWWLPVVDDFMLLVSNLPRNIVLIGCTNLIGQIDAALLRPGRFGQAIEIKAPRNAEELAALLKFHLAGDLTGAELIELAQFGIGATPAQAAEWVRAARRTARVAKRPMTVDDLRQEIAPPDPRSEEELARSAHHEAGHAVASFVMKLGGVDHISLVPSGGIGGHMRMSFDKSYSFTDRDSIERYAVMQLAGRAAEIVFFGSGSAGAGGVLDSDLGVATQLVTALHTAFGLGDALLFRAGHNEQIQVLQFDPDLRDAVEHDLQVLLGVAQNIVREHRLATRRIAEALLKKHFLTGAEVKRIFDEADEHPNLTLVPAPDANEPRSDGDES